MKYGVLVLARLTSRRLPRKALRTVYGRPLLEYVLRRASLVPDARVIVATSTDASDDPLEEFALRENWQCFRGSLNDVMGRCVACCEFYGLDAFARVNGDSPWVDPELVRIGFEQLASDDLDFVTNLVPRTYPYGVSCEVIRSSVFKRIADATTAPGDREHFTQPLYRSLESLRVGFLRAPEDWSHHRLVIDTEDDLVRFRAIVESCPDWQHVLTGNLVALLRSRPGLSFLHTHKDDQPL